MLAYVLMLHRLSGLPSGAIAKGLKNTGLFVVLIIVINCFFIRGEPLIGAIPFLSREGLTTGIHHSVRVVVLYYAAVVFLGVASPEDIARGISACLRPFSPDLADRVAMYGFLSMGFLPVFADELQRIRTAQGFRGGGMTGGLLSKLNGVRLLLVPLILSAVQRSAQLAVAVELRDIKSTIRGILVIDKPSQKDCAFVVVTVVIVTTAWLLG